MKAIILAAGMGVRLRPKTFKQPKALLEIKGKPLLEYSLNALKNNGIKEVIIVIGYKGKFIKERFGEHYDGLKITYIFNSDYYKTGSMYSLSKAKELINGDILLLESDLLYESKAIKKALNSNLEDLILVSDIRGSGDEVYICVDKEQKIINLGKNIPIENRKNVIGELVGISKFSKEFLDRLFKKAEENYKEGKLNYHYEECVFEVSEKIEHPVYALYCEDLAWTEIDTEDDLEKAKKQVYPKIRMNYCKKE